MSQLLIIKQGSEYYKKMMIIAGSDPLIETVRLIIIIGNQHMNGCNSFFSFTKGRFDIVFDAMH